ELTEVLMLGELALDGRLRAVAGVLPATLAAAQAGCCRAIVPEPNVGEAEVIEGVEVTGVRSLRHAVAVLRGEPAPDDPEVPPLTGHGRQPFGGPGGGRLDLADVAGQDDARAAVVV